MLLTERFINLAETKPNDEGTARKLAEIYQANPIPFSENNFAECKAQFLQLLNYIAQLHPNYKIFSTYAANVKQNLTENTGIEQKNRHLDVVKTGLETNILLILNKNPDSMRYLESRFVVTLCLDGAATSIENITHEFSNDLILDAKRNTLLYLATAFFNKQQLNKTPLTYSIATSESHLITAIFDSVATKWHLRPHNETYHFNPEKNKRLQFEFLIYTDFLPTFIDIITEKLHFPDKITMDIGNESWKEAEQAFNSLGLPQISESNLLKIYDRIEEDYDVSYQLREPAYKKCFILEGLQQGGYLHLAYVDINETRYIFGLDEMVTTELQGDNIAYKKACPYELVEKLKTLDLSTREAKVLCFGLLKHFRFNKNKHRGDSADIPALNTLAELGWQIINQDQGALVWRPTLIKEIALLPMNKQLEEAVLDLAKKTFEDIPLVFFILDLFSLKAYEKIQRLISGIPPNKARAFFNETVLEELIKSKQLCFLEQLFVSFPELPVNGLVGVVARYGSQEMLEFLAARGASINSRDSNGRTPLHYAACSNNVELIPCLIKHIDIHAVDRDNYNALQLATLADQKEFVQALYSIERQWTFAIQTPLNIAARYGYLDLVKFLVEEVKAPIELEYPEGSKITPLYSAVIHDDRVFHLFRQKLAVVEYLLSRGAMLLKLDTLANTELHFIHPQIMATLLIANKIERGSVRSPMIYAIKRRLPQTLLALIRRGVKPPSDKPFYTAGLISIFNMAQQNGNQALIDEMLGHLKPNDMYYADNKLQNFLHYLVQTENITAIKYYRSMKNIQFNYSAKMHSEGKTPWQLALDRPNPVKVIELLKVIEGGKGLDFKINDKKSSPYPAKYPAILQEALAQKEWIIIKALIRIMPDVNIALDEQNNTLLDRVYAEMRLNPSLGLKPVIESLKKLGAQANHESEPSMPTKPKRSQPPASSEPSTSTKRKRSQPTTSSKRSKTGNLPTFFQQVEADAGDKTEDFDDRPEGKRPQLGV